MFHSFHEHISMFGAQCLCSIHSMNTLACSEHSVCVKVIPRIHDCVQSIGFYSSHPMNILACSEHSVCVPVIP